MRRGTGRGDCFFLMVQRLIGKALIPEHEAQPRVMSHAGVVAVTGGFGAVALRNIKRKAFFKVQACCREVTQVKMPKAQHEVESREDVRVPDAVGEVRGLRGDCQPNAQFCMVDMDRCDPQTSPNRLNLRRRSRPNLPSKRDRAACGPFQFGRRKAPLGGKRPHKRGLDTELLFIARLTFGKSADDLEASPQMRDGLEIC
jgi:hypothetical protein